MLSIRLLGPVHVSVGDTVLPLPDRHDVIRLLAYLLLHRDRPLARKSVAFELWPDTPESGARQQLSRTLYRLQHDFLPPASNVPWVSTSISELRWHPEAEYWLDVQHFEDIVAQAVAAVPVEPFERVLEGLECLKRLYRGDLLPDYADEWIVTWRQDVGRRFDSAMERLAQMYALGGRWEASVAAGTSVLGRDPLRETTHRTIMFAHVAAGDRGNALRHYASCVASLNEHISSLPEPATSDLARAIQSGEPPEAVADLVFGACLATWAAEKIGRRAAAVPPRDKLAASRLPAVHDRFIGRDGAFAVLGDLVTTHRLVTLTGPGGCGKSRLAVEVSRRSADRFDGVSWVDLAPASAPVAVAHTVAVAVGAEPANDGDGALAAIAARLERGRWLLVLDNCEHVLEGCAQLVALLIDRCPDLVVLATSRERLNVSAERVWQTAPLALPIRGNDAWTAPEAAESVALFAERLRQREPDRALTPEEYQTAARICARLDGLPLAIELAAAQAAYLSLDEVDALLDRDLDVLCGGARDMVARHATIRTTIDWSYQSLTESGRELFCQLAVFQGGATWQAIDSVCRFGEMKGAGEAESPFDTLRDLIDKSLVSAQRSQGAPTRYYMLDLVRRYAAAQLEASGQSAGLGQAHATYFAGLTESLAGRLNGPDHGVVLAVWDSEHPNCLAAIQHAMWARDATTALRLGVALWPYWGCRGYLSEGRRLLERLLTLDGVTAAPGLHSKALNGAASLAHMVGDYRAARRWYEVGLTVERPLCRPQSLATLLRNYSLVLRQQSEFDAARALCEESLAIQRNVGDRTALAATLLSLGNVSYRQGRFADAARHFQESLVLNREVGGESDGLSEALHSVGLAFAAQGRNTDACHHLEQSIVISRRLADDYGLAPSLILLGTVYSQLDRLSEARSSLEEGLRLSRALGYQSGVANALHHLGRMALRDEATPDDAWSLARESIRLRAELGERHGVAQSLRLVALLHQFCEEPERAAFMLGVEARLRSDIGAGLPAGDRIDVRGCAGAVKRMLGPSRFDAFVELGQATTMDFGASWNVAAIERLLLVDPVQKLRRAMNVQPARRPERVLPELSTVG